MKKVGCLLLAVVVPVAGFAALVVFVLGRGEDQSALTQQVDVVLGEAEESRQGNSRQQVEFDYAYEYDGEWYGAQGRVSDNTWERSKPAFACIDPDQPGDHVLLVNGGTCGEERIQAGQIDEASPTTAPGG